MSLGRQPVQRRQTSTACVSLLAVGFACGVAGKGRVERRALQPPCAAAGSHTPPAWATPFVIHQRARGTPHGALSSCNASSTHPACRACFLHSPRISRLLLEKNRGGAAPAPPAYSAARSARRALRAATYRHLGVRIATRRYKLIRAKTSAKALLTPPAAPAPAPAPRAGTPL